MKNHAFAPGVTELAGNHTDHQGGRVLASTIDLGIYAEFEKSGSSLITVNSDGFDTIEFKAEHTGIRASEFGSPIGLVRGMAAAFAELGLRVGGFRADIRSSLPAGAGLGSSAAFAVLIGKILSSLFNDSAVEPIVIARAAQKAENRHFGKPCGLTDQLTSAYGKTLYADFATGRITVIEADFADMGLTLCLTDTGGSHAGLGSSYARILADMVYIANYFDRGQLGDVDPEDFFRQGWNETDRPVSRAKHFFEENARVPLMREALINGDGKTYMRLMNESGRSSENVLKNIVTSASGDTKLAQGLEESAKLLEGIGAWRVHGDGFAGCVQALMPSAYFPEYKEGMEKVFGKGSCFEIKLA